MKKSIMNIGNREMNLSGRCRIMAILNVTPDSFSDGGLWLCKDKALFHVEEMIKNGAEIIDVGGESTRPGHIQISEEEEISRTAPIISEIKKKFDIPVSIDTYKSKVARAAIDAGADMVNDIWGLLYDDKMAGLIAEKNVSCCLMHNRDEIFKGNISEFEKAYIQDIEKIIDIARKNKIDDDKIILDPGVGFGKSHEQNLFVIARLDILKNFGYPVLLATSRKSVMGKVLDVDVNNRVEATIATSIYGLIQGADFVRVHDVMENYRAIKMGLAIEDYRKV